MTRRVAAVAVVALLVLTAGCSAPISPDELLGGDSTPDSEPSSPVSDTPTPTEPGPTTEDPPESGTTPDDTPGTPGDDPTADTGSGTQLADVAANQTVALAAADSFTLHIDSRTATANGALVANRTVRVAGNRTYVNNTRQIVGPDGAAISAEAFSPSGDVVFVRRGAVGARTGVFDRRLATGSLNGTQLAAWDRQFDFNHGRTASGDHRFTVDSTDQILRTQTSGSVSTVDVRITVDEESGLVTSLSYRIERVTEDGRSVVSDGDRVLTGVGSTTISQPAWLSTARDRTTPVGPRLRTPVEIETPTEPVTVQQPASPGFDGNTTQADTPDP